MSHGRVPRPGAIVLVGFMGSGKSTVGRLLAHRLGWAAVDFDDAIAERTGRTPAQLIRHEGEAALRREERMLTDQVAGETEVVLIPGGGWITDARSRAMLQPGTVMVWLRVSVQEALRRAEADAGGVDRPLLGRTEGRLERAAALLREREPLYALADVAVDVDGRSPAAVASEILRKLGMEREENGR